MYMYPPRDELGLFDINHGMRGLAKLRGAFIGLLGVVFGTARRDEPGARGPR